MFTPYAAAVENAMCQLYATLGERERRLYAATETVKLGRGGLAYLAHLLQCDEKTIRRGKRELGHAALFPSGRSRKKGAAESQS